MRFEPTPSALVENKSEAEKKLELLKKKSMPIGSLFLAGYEKANGDKGMNLNDLEMQPGTYAENGGVIIYADKQGEKYATPATDESRELLRQSEIIEISMGVPALSNGEVWGDADRRENMPSWHQWKDLVSKSQERTSKEMNSQ